MEQGTLPPGARADLDSAVTLTVVALILEAVFLGIGVLLVAVFLPFIATLQTAPISSIFLVGLLVVAGIAGVLFLFLTYFLVYKPLKHEQVERALTPALVLGILTLVLVGVISGILLIVAYVKAKDAHTKILLAQGAPS